jgi:SNF2 family DNA or RNA helicase
MNRKSGEMSGRRDDIALWNSNEIDTLILQIGSGEGLNELVDARYGIVYSLGYSLGQYLQALDRLHRSGQLRHVFYVHLLAANTIDEKVYAALQERKDVVEVVTNELKRRGRRS